MKTHYLPLELFGTDQFPEDEVLAYSIATKTKVVIPGYAVIQNGEMEITEACNGSA